MVKRVKRVRLAVVDLTFTGHWWQARAFHFDLVKHLVKVEALGIGLMGLRGRIGHRMVQEEMLVVLVTRGCLLEKRERSWFFNAWGWSRDRGLGESRADPPAGYPSQSGRGPADRAGLPEGAAIARRQHLRREATAPIDSLRRGKLRAVSGVSRLIR